MVRMPSMGRRKIEIKKLEDKNTRHITFSKRRVGVFKKARELCTLCGAQACVLVISPGGKAFSFGHPTVEAVADRFLAENIVTDGTAGAGRSGVSTFSGMQDLARVHDLEREYAETVKQLEAEKKKGEKLLQLRKAAGKLDWCEHPTEELSLPELEELHTLLQNLREKIAKRQEELFVQTSSWLSL